MPVRGKGVAQAAVKHTNNVGVKGLGPGRSAGLSLNWIVLVL